MGVEPARLRKAHEADEEDAQRYAQLHRRMQQRDSPSSASDGVISLRRAQQSQRQGEPWP